MLSSGKLTRIGSTGLALVIGLTASLAVFADQPSDQAVTFRELDNVIPLEERSRRKWDSPLVADLDQDGKLDLLLTDHSRQAQIYWNEGGRFSKPVVLARGDTHGVAAGDYDQDGRMDIVVSRGGGGGKKPRNPVAYQINHDRSIEGGEEFEYFERSRGRAAKLIDADNNGTLDLVLTAFPLRTQQDGANDLLKNSEGERFEFITKLPQAKWMGFRALVNDFDNDHDADLLFYGGDDMVAVRGQPGLSFIDATAEVLSGLENTTFVSSIAEIDYDNDGDFDLFVTRADHPFQREMYYDEANQRFAFFVRNEKYQFDELVVDGDLRVENLQMAFPHFNVFVGAEKRKLEFQVDRHGHKDFTLKPEEAEGWPDDLSDKGLTIGHLGEGRWRICVDTSSPTAAVVHNVTSKPELTQPKSLPALMFENREGTFVDVTARLGIHIDEQTTCAAVGDYNNDGWADLFVVRYGNPAKQNQQLLYLNRQGKSFERATSHGIISQELGATGGGGEAFDYDSDGDLDLIFCNERGRWHLFTNESSAANENNFVIVKVGASPTGKATAQGAVLTLKANGQTYRRVVGSSAAAFSHSMDTHLHVGLGQTKTIDDASVGWTNGETVSLNIDRVNQSYFAGTRN